jgi:hypothetical protein
LVSFPSLTKIFPFREFPFLYGTKRSPEGVRFEKSHLGILGSMLACSYSRHFAACRALLQRSSQVIHQTALHVGLTRLHSNVCLASETHVFYLCLACDRLSLRADKSSLYPLLLTWGSGAARSLMWRSFKIVSFDRQLPRTTVGKYKHCYIDFLLSSFIIIFISMMFIYRFCGLVSWWTASDIVLRKLRPLC